MSEKPSPDQVDQFYSKQKIVITGNATIRCDSGKTKRVGILTTNGEENKLIRNNNKWGKMKKIKQLFIRLFEANINMEHYWFFPKPMALDKVKVKNLGIKEKR